MTDGTKKSIFHSFSRCYIKGTLILESDGMKRYNLVTFYILEFLKIE